jgi:hypothetical protein
MMKKYQIWVINGRMPIFCLIASSSEVFGQLTIFAIKDCVYWAVFGPFLVDFWLTSHFLTKCLFFANKWFWAVDGCVNRGWFNSN